MVLVRSNRDVNLKDAIGNYEFTLTPRALFALNGTVLPCQDKSTLIHPFIKLAKDEEPPAACMDHQDAMETGLEASNSPSRKPGGWHGTCAQAAQKSSKVVTVKDLSVCFNDRLMSLTQNH